MQKLEFAPLNYVPRDNLREPVDLLNRRTKNGESPNVRPYLQNLAQKFPPHAVTYVDEGAVLKN